MRQPKGGFDQTNLDPVSLTSEQLDLLSLEDLEALVEWVSTEWEDEVSPVDEGSDRQAPATPTAEEADLSATSATDLARANQLAVAALLSRDVPEQSGRYGGVKVFGPLFVGILASIAVLVTGLQRNPSDCAAVLDSVVAAKTSYPSLQLTDRFRSAEACGLDDAFFRSIEVPVVPDDLAPSSAPTTTTPVEGG
ncbi:hypothetical protein [Candidatus Microthrix parvicella]|uniref:hypothetical protein n=1 Tax=Candidatus Neomicrothrix parvicella TaxID=41950 RepID=UPI0004AF0FEA|nr:hypothetical protein [Candidatus Microthrix parvicella]